MKLVLFALVAVLAATATYLVVGRRRTYAEERGLKDFIVLEADSPAISDSGSLIENVGIGIVEGDFAPLLKRGSRQPAETSFTFSTSEDNQEQITLRFYRGNSNHITENAFLGEARITGYPLAAAQEPLVRVFVRAAEGQLSLAAIDDHSGESVRLTRTTDAEARTLQ